MKIDRRSNDTFSKFLAPAKINLFLKVKNKRPDGYHNLQSVFQFISLYDEILIRVRNDSQINIKNSSPFVSNKNDIAYKACKLILTGRDIGVDIEVKKNIPIGSGLGGLFGCCYRLGAAWAWRLHARLLLVHCPSRRARRVATYLGSRASRHGLLHHHLSTYHASLCGAMPGSRRLSHCHHSHTPLAI